MSKPKQVADYYDEWNERYNSVYGEVIQAFRPADTNSLLTYILQSINIKAGMKLVDAGCGFAAPACFFANQVSVKIDALTISQTQALQAAARVNDSKLNDCVTITNGDFHELERLFPSETYDGVYFLESLGHSNDVSTVLKGVWKILKFGGFVYIKDFFFKQTNDEAFNERVQEVVEKVNNAYCYNVMALDVLIRQLRFCGFTIEYIRPLKFADDITIRKEFEVKNDIDTFGGKPEFYYAEWLEIKCIKFRN